MSDKLRLNGKIKESEVLLIDEKGVKQGVIPTSRALMLAEEKKMDLIEVSPRTSSSPSVCKIVDYGKLKYKIAQQDKEQRKKQTLIKVKSIRLTASIDNHDLNIKLAQVKTWLSKQYRVKVYCVLKGYGANSKKDIAVAVVNNFVNMSGGVMGSPIVVTGKMLSCVIVPNNS